MSDLYLILLVIGIAATLLRVAGDSARIFEYPYFMSAVFAVFILPQAFSLARFPGRVSDGAVDDALLMTCLCFAASVIGYSIAPSMKLVRLVVRPVLPARMLHIGAFFILCGYFFGYQLTQVEVEYNDQRGGMTGTGTLYLFFASLKLPGLAIVFSLLLREFTLPRLLWTFLGILIPLVEVFLAGRREAAAALGLVGFLSLYFNRRIKPPVLLVYGALSLAMLAIPATGIYRELAYQGRMVEIRKLDLIKNFKDYFGKESILELRNAAAVIESTQRFGNYDFGAGYWNQMVFRFVPAQLVGKQFKDSLLIGYTVEDMFKAERGTAHEFMTGSTQTGMGDSFKQFGWFGCLFFALVALIFRSFWLAAIHPHAMFAQLVYLLICTSAMRAVTHQTVDFLPGFTYQFIFLWLGLLYAQDRGPRFTSAGRASPGKMAGTGNGPPLQLPSSQ
ncbi:hypothetical protein WJU23_06685 [Prosthecobacter sp. SYSU 5D2]|uniref:hypothetical protein n=1 Tax=Prosthecobacter sp. SYSU 5D2 TaxID=3134134 RepID=UPI0031FE704D